jgi:hypothetical protein
MNSSSAFLDRKIDLSLFPVFSVGRDGQALAPLNLSDDPMVTTGKAKAIQNYVRILLTPLGHYPSTPDFGSEFYNVYEGNMMSEAELLNLFASENLRVLEYLHSIYQDDTPPDERITDARLAGITVGRTEAALVLEFGFPDNGEPLPVILPIKNFERPQ